MGTSFQEHITTTDDKILQGLTELAKIEEQMKKETAVYRKLAQDTEKKREELEKQNSELLLENERLQEEVRSLKTKNPTVAKAFYLKENATLSEQLAKKDDEISK